MGKIKATGKHAAGEAKCEARTGPAGQKTQDTRQDPPKPELCHSRTGWGRVCTAQGSQLKVSCLGKAELYISLEKYEEIWAGMRNPGVQR